MKQNNYIAIMAGAWQQVLAGQQRSAQPKQFIDMLAMGRPLLQMTYVCFLPLVDNENIFCVTNEAYLEFIGKTSTPITIVQRHREPSRNNTAPERFIDRNINSKK
ncbi:MAG: hypothetical protein IPP89_15965, partial [Saprospiraceae bacterium]|nr:hypothetical protein [Candidatus Brachybacter algidus]